MKKLLVAPIMLLHLITFGQKSFNDYAQFYPIGDDPNIRAMTSYAKQETILFEANPIVRFSLFNNFMKGLMDENKKHTQSWYFSFRPQLRMYTDNSLPVRMPSYRVFLGTQHMYRLNPSTAGNLRFWGYSIESGHYSNGQDGGAFSEEFSDGSVQSDSIYGTINESTKLSEILNRRSANFSTNLTEIIANYRWYKIDDDNIPYRMHSFNIGYVLYHDRFLGLGDFGGFTENDIELYGRHRILFGYEFMQVLKKHHDKRYSIKQNIEFIAKPHNSVNPIRLETIFTFYPFPKSRALGFFASYIYGHDNYNYRFVDAGHQATLGVTWTQFPPFNMTSRLF